MKTRIVLMSLIFVVAPMLAGCGAESGTENRVGPENRAASTTDKQANAKLGDELKQAAALLKEAQTELEQNTPESKLKALRTLGYPVFVVDDFGDSRPFIAKLKGNPRKKLSDYLYKHFGTTTIKLLEVQEEKASKELLNALSAELNVQLRNPDLYDAERFPASNVSSATELEIKRNGGVFSQFNPATLALVNRLLLRDSYPTTFVPPPTETVLHHLGAAANLVKTSADLQPTFGLRVNKLLEDNKQLFRENSEADEEISVSSKAIGQLTSDIGVVLKDLGPSQQTTTTTATGLIDWEWWGQIAKDALKYVLVLCAAAVLIGGVIYAVRYLRHRSAVREQKIQRDFDAVADRHDKLHQDFTSFKNQQASEVADLKQQISHLEREQHKLSKQLARSATEPNHNTFAVDRYYERPSAPAPVKEEPEFPVAAETYLRRLNGVNRQSTVIRPDFQNGILVKDADGRGELLLIEDPHTPFDYQRLLVVPSVSEFQMRQDFYNYYDSYYECDQPGAGPIWILNPAIVEKVNGGWRLTEKGRLEVRG